LSNSLCVQAPQFAIRQVRSWLAVVLVVWLASNAAAHLPDTSYARFVITRERYDIKLTYDVTSLLRMVPQLDANNDGQLTQAELSAAVPEIADFLRSAIALEIDEQPSEFGDLQPVAWPGADNAPIPESEFHAATSLVTFIFSKQLAQPPADVWVRFDFFGTLGLRHTVLAAIEHEGQEDEILFTAFEPDYLYETRYTREQTSQPPAVAPETTNQRRANVSIWQRMQQFFVLGVEHILIGYDHILFLLALILVSRLSELVRIVTAFTIAHSITLALATLDVITPPAAWVETLIAGTIVYTAIENLWLRDTAGRWKLTFAFGLIHGFGFASVLRDLQLPLNGFLRSLLAFNLGVEAGQLAIVLALAWPISWLVHSKYGQQLQCGLSLIIALCGLGWLLDRALGLELMPF